MPRTAIPPTTPPAIAPAFVFFPEFWLPGEELPVAEGTLADSVPPEIERELRFRVIGIKFEIPSACAKDASKPSTFCLIRLSNHRDRRDSGFVQ
jgi:hypothetical protein